MRKRSSFSIFHSSTLKRPFYQDRLGTNLKTIHEMTVFAGGAAGLEIDRADTSLGTPPHALRVAVADKFPASYKRVGEEALHSHSAVTGTTTTLPAQSSFLVLNSLYDT